MYIYTPLCRNEITLYRYVMVFIVPHMEIELEDNKQFISNTPRITLTTVDALKSPHCCRWPEALSPLAWWPKEIYWPKKGKPHLYFSSCRNFYLDFNFQTKFSEKELTLHLFYMPLD